MAFLLYKYIQKKRASRRETAGSFEAHLNQESISPVAKPIKAEALTDPEQDRINTASDGILISSTISEKHGSAHDSCGDLGHNGNRKLIPGGVGSPTESEYTKEEKKAMRIYRWKLILGLFLPFSIQALETTVLAGAYPFIASDFSMSGTKSLETRLTFF